MALCVCSLDLRNDRFCLLSSMRFQRGLVIGCDGNDGIYWRWLISREARFDNDSRVLGTIVSLVYYGKLERSISLCENLFRF